jgi:hypothetical protein
VSSLSGTGKYLLCIDRLTPIHCHRSRHNHLCQLAQFDQQSPRPRQLRLREQLVHDKQHCQHHSRPGHSQLRELTEPHI